jgi:pimeloyl-ACP methyl ester carboxylesterase
MAEEIKLPERLKASQPEYQKYHLGDFELQCGEKLVGAWIAYKTFGDAKSPAILYPSWFSGSISDNEWLIGQDKTLNPNKYFIIITALFGNGQSISPSNSQIAPFPTVTVYDNVRAQHELLTKRLGLTHLRAVTGWSMGAGQTYQWATQYPEFMDIAVPFCGSARTSLHNQVFLEGVKSALLAAQQRSSAGIGPGRAEATDNVVRSWTGEERRAGLKAFARVYAGWGFSQAFYRHRLHEKFYAAADLEDFMVDFWEAWALSKGRWVVVVAAGRSNDDGEDTAILQADADIPPPIDARSRESARHVADLADGRLLPTEAVQRQLRAGHALHQSEDPGAAVQDRPLFPVRFDSGLTRNSHGC